MKNILVTGGAGFIGSHTILELIKSGFNPIILDNFCNSERFIIDNLKDLTGKKDLKVYDADCTIKAEVTAVFRKESIDGVIHFAAYKAVGESFSKPLEYHKNNVNSLTVLLECMNEFEVTNLVFSSSCTVYGDTKDSPVGENSIK
ncbi:MAG TPA: UDP-glucose 4-epimerase GalE, partial [Flavobacteriales bacterium]|nr:UDP-glucose 4-epimerase GalE [Flavobacteriales bacterium]